MTFGAFGMESEEPVVHCVDCQVTRVSSKYSCPSQPVFLKACFPCGYTVVARSMNALKAKYWTEMSLKLPHERASDRDSILRVIIVQVRSPGLRETDSSYLVRVVVEHVWRRSV